MKQFEHIYQIKQNDNWFYISLGWKTADWLDFFTLSTCFQNVELKEFHYYINQQNKNIITKYYNEIIAIAVNLGKKITSTLGISINVPMATLPIPKEAYIFVSTSHKTDGTYAVVLKFEIIEALREIFMQKTKPKAIITTIPLVEETAHNDAKEMLILSKQELVEVQSELIKETENIEKLLKKVDDNNQRMLTIQQLINDMNKKVLNASADLKKKIYAEHAILTKELNQLSDENDEIEIKTDTIQVITNSTGLTSIIEDYHEKIKGLDFEIAKSDSNISRLNDSNENNLSSIQPKLIFTSNYIEDAIHFEITNVIKKKSVSQYEPYYAVLFNLLNKGTLIKPSNKITKYTNDELRNIYEYQMLVLSLIRYGYLGDQQWKFNISKAQSILMQVAIDEITYWTSQLCLLAMVKYQKPVSIFNSEEGYQVFKNSPVFTQHIFSINTHLKADQVTEIWIADMIKYHINPKTKIHEDALTELVQWIFGFTSFREGQLSIIANFLNGNNTLGILPTGGGKSLTYYLSVLLQPKISLVIAPINSLIIDQIDKISESFGINRFANITSANSNMHKDLLRFAKGEVLFTFASPERAQNLKFRSTLIKLNYHQTIGSIILDEVHCLSEWGHDFRVPYLMLSETLNTYCKGIRYLGLTATASINVVRDLLIELSIDEKDVITSAQMSRENLEFEIKSYNNVYLAQNEIVDLFVTNYGEGNLYDISKSNSEVNSAIIFAPVKSRLDTSVEVLYEKFQTAFMDIYDEDYDNEIGMFTGDYKDDQSAFMKDEKTLLVATKAFGMGIDKPNIRTTIHFGMPPSREAFYQEAGRAGRDGNLAVCKLISMTPEHKNIEFNVKKFLNPNTTLEEMEEILKILTRAKTDIATAFYFFLESYDKPENERIESLKLYETISEHKNYIARLLGYPKKSTEKYLYILFKLGIVINWSVVYTSSNFDLVKNVDFVVEVSKKYSDVLYIKNKTMKYVKAYQSSELSNLTESEMKYNKAIESISHIEQLGELILIMRQWYHSIFITTRREQIANMYQMIQDFANKGPTIEIQNVIDRFFNIKDSIGKTSEGYDLVTFEGASLSEVVDYAFDSVGEALLQRKYEMEVVLQSNVNAKNSLYTSLIHLRLSDYENKHNGDQRFDFALSQLNQNEQDEVVIALVNSFGKLKSEQKVLLINQLQTKDTMIVHKLYEKHEQDEVINSYVLDYINSKFDESWI